MAQDPSKAPKLQLQMDEATAQGAYANMVVINHSENEFVLDFAFIQPNQPRAKVHARVISSPRHTLRLLRALEHNVRRYEERFGPIAPEAPAARARALPGDEPDDSIGAPVRDDGHDDGPDDDPGGPDDPPLH